MSRPTSARTVRLTVKISNDRLVRARTEMGYLTPPLFAQAVGVSYQSYIALEMMRTPPYGPRGWYTVARRVAEFTGCALDYLFPPAISGVQHGEVRVAAAALSEMATAALHHEPETEYLLSGLRDRERRILRLYFGLEELPNNTGPATHADIGMLYGISQGRVTQIVQNALTKVRSRVARRGLDETDIDDLPVVTLEEP